MSLINLNNGELEKILQSYNFSFLDWISLLPRIILSYLLINLWNWRLHLRLSNKFRFKQSILSSLILKDIYSIRRLKDYFIAGAIQRIWDDIYDEEKLSKQELIELRNAVIYGKDSNIKVAQELRNAYLQIVGEIRSSTEPFRQELYLTFVNELNLLIDGYEVEAQLKKQKIGYTLGDETKYIQAASNSIALKYICLVIAFSLVETEEEYLAFKSSNTIANLCSETVRLANDLGGYEEDVRENKASCITIYMEVHNASLDTAKEHFISSIYQNLKNLKSYLDNSHDNIFVKILIRTTFVVTKRYLSKKI